MLTVMGCNLTYDSEQPNSTALLVSNTELVIRATPTIENAASETAVSEPVSTPPAVHPTELITSQAVDTVEEPIEPLVEPDSSDVTAMSAWAPVEEPIEPLVDPDLSLLGGAVQVPLEISIPALQLRAPVLGVGLTLTNVMAAPIGIRENDPIWWSVFWYRGGGIPGEVGTATFAGHFDDDLGRPAIFAFLAELEVGDLIVVKDRRNGAEIPFIVTETNTYTEQESTDPATLARIFGSGAVTGLESQSTPDVVSRLTLITCDGAWVNGAFDQHLVVFATRASYPAG